MKKELQGKINKVKKLMSEIGKDPEFRKAMAEKRDSLQAKESVMGSCWNGCSPCTACLITPSPDLDLVLAIGCLEFKPY